MNKELEILIEKTFNDLTKELNDVSSSTLPMSKVKWIDFRLNHICCFLYESRKRKITINDYFIDYFIKIFGLTYVETGQYLYPLIKNYIKQYAKSR